MRRLAHNAQNPVADMLRRNLQMAADMRTAQFIKIVSAPVCTHKVVPDAGPDKHMSNAGNAGRSGQCAQVRAPVKEQMRADLREEATLPPAFPPLRASASVKIGRRPSDIGDRPAKRGHPRNSPDLLDNRVARPALDNASLMAAQRAERASASAAPMRGHGKRNHLGRRHRGASAGRMAFPREWQVIHLINLRGRKRLGRRHLNDPPVLRGLDHRPGHTRVLLSVPETKGPVERVPALAHLFERWQIHAVRRHVVAARGRPDSSAHCADGGRLLP